MSYLANNSQVTAFRFSINTPVQFLSPKFVQLREVRSYVRKTVVDHLRTYILCNMHITYYINLIFHYKSTSLLEFSPEEALRKGTFLFHTFQRHY